MTLFFFCVCVKPSPLPLNTEVSLWVKHKIKALFSPSRLSGKNPFLNNGVFDLSSLAGREKAYLMFLCIICVNARGHFLDIFLIERIIASVNVFHFALSDWNMKLREMSEFDVIISHKTWKHWVCPGLGRTCTWRCRRGWGWRRWRTLRPWRCTCHTATQRTANGRPEGRWWHWTPSPLLTRRDLKQMIELKELQPQKVCSELICDSFIFWYRHQRPRSQESSWNLLVIHGEKSKDLISPASARLTTK